MRDLSSYRLQSDAPVLYALAFLAPALFPIAPLLIWVPAVAAALTVLVRRAVAGGPWPVSRPLLVVTLFSATAWSAVTTLWAIDFARGLETAGRLLLVAVALVVLVDAAVRLREQERVYFCRWLAHGGATGVVLTLVAVAIISAYTLWLQHEPLTQATLAPLNRTGSMIAILAWPVALGMARTHSRLAATVFFVAAAAAVMLLAPTTPLLALAVGLGAFVVAWLAPALAKSLLLAAFAIYIGIVPFLDKLVPWARNLLVVYLDNPVSEVHRLVIWQFAAEHILQRPLLGWGLEATRVFPGRETELFLFNAPDGSALTGTALPLHTHNALIQIWLELGFIGVLLIAALFVVAVGSIPRRTVERERPAIAVATIATGLANAQFGFGIWQGWWLATLGLAAVMTTVVVGAPPGNSGISTPRVNW